jgi:K+-sensing histidine kinase KdpD
MDLDQMEDGPIVVVVVECPTFGPDFPWMRVPTRPIHSRRTPAADRGDDGNPMELSVKRVKPLTAVGIGTAGIVGMVAILVPFGESSNHSVHAVLLILPVIAAGLLGGRASAVAVSAEAAVTFAMFLPPIGSPAVYLQTDVVALMVFVLVAAATGVLVGTVVNTERHRLAAEHAQFEALEQTEQQRKALLRSVSHDLRTPLATIRAAASELYDGVDYDQAARTEILGLVLGETERLDRIVANLLSLGRIEAGALLPNLQPTNLDELVRSSAERLDRVVADHHPEIVVRGELPLVSVDYSQFDQVVSNLVENAARHSPAGGTIRIELSAVDDDVLLVVADQGDGFAHDVRDRLFRPFALATGAGSSGIGLAICRSIIEAHGGTIEATNGDEGGARVTVKVPSRR